MGHEIRRKSGKLFLTKIIPFEGKSETLGQSKLQVVQIKHARIDAVEPVLVFWQLLVNFGFFEPFLAFLMYKCTIEIDNYQPKRRKKEIARERKDLKRKKKEKSNNVCYASIRKQIKEKTESRIKFTMIDEMEKLQKKKKKMSKICASTKINIVLPYMGFI